MVSIILLFVDLLKRLRIIPLKQIIYIRRLQQAKVLKTHLAGLTLGLIVFLSALYVFIFHPVFFECENYWSIITDISFKNSSANILFILGVILWFGLVTWYSGYLFFISFIFLIVGIFSFGIDFGTNPDTEPLIIHLFNQFYFLGYLFGWLFTTFYNDLLYLFLTYLEKDKRKISFSYDPNKIVNIIKSPVAREAEIDKEVDEKITEEKLYKYNVQPQPGNPYTIVFVANPKILIRNDYHKDKKLLEEIMSTNFIGRTLAEQSENLQRRLDDGETDAQEVFKKELKPIIEKYLGVPTDAGIAAAQVMQTQSKIRQIIHDKDAELYNEDPIIRNRDLFMKGVDDALRSFEENEVMGRPEIWSRVRVLTVFDESLVNKEGYKSGLLQQYQENVYIGRSSDEAEEDNFIDAKNDMAEILNKIISNSPQKQDVENFTIDIIFGLSANKTHTRATAHYTDYVELADDQIYNPTIVLPFTFDEDPLSRKNLDQNGNPVQNILFPDFSPDSGFMKEHEHKPTFPGRAAVNVLEACQKTYIHEFAHAMSSCWRGMIVDEYFDHIQLGESPGNFKNPEIAFYVNRMERNRDRMLNQGIPIPVHKEFAEFNGTIYDSDLDHSSAEETWSGYFPDRSQGITCTMDRTYGAYHFDQLLCAFIYERMMAKVMRKV